MGTAEKIEATQSSAPSEEPKPPEEDVQLGKSGTFRVAEDIAAQIEHNMAALADDNAEEEESPPTERSPRYTGSRKVSPRRVGEEQPLVRVMNCDDPRDEKGDPLEEAEGAPVVRRPKKLVAFQPSKRSGNPKSKTRAKSSPFLSRKRTSKKIPKRTKKPAKRKRRYFSTAGLVG